MSALSDLRIVELSNGVAGEYCGKLLADFGAEVIKVERPIVGSDTRREEPLAASGSGPERSGLFAYLNTNKRSVTLDLASSQARQALHELLSTVDVILDDHPPGYLENMGCGPAECAAKHPGLIVSVITPFGYCAPAEMQKAYSLNVLHSSWGYHTPASADPSRPPLAGAGRFLPDYESGLSAALALIAALYWRESSGRGQFVDTSQRESMASLVDYVLGQMVTGNMEVGNGRAAYDLGGPSTFFACRDGFVYLWLSEPSHWNGMSALMGEPPWMKDFPERWLELHVTAARIAQCRREIGIWMREQNKQEVASLAQQMGVPLVPVNTMEDAFRSPQMQFRRFFKEIDHAELGSLRVPTVPYQLSATPATLRTAAPRLGQHTDEVLRELRAPRTRRVIPPAAIDAAHSDLPRREGPLKGVRVLEVTKVWAGPYTGKLLALLGAEVIRVESYESLDATRRFGTKDINHAPGFQAVNPGKHSVQLNIKTEEGKRLIRELAKVSDIFIENLRPRAAERLGLGYQALRELRHDIVAVSMSMYGNSGPLSYQTGYAPCFSALAGICHLAGYEDGSPMLLNQRYGDSSYGSAAAFAAVVALFHRRRTGEGQFVDVSAVESLAAMLGDAYMDYFLKDRIPQRGERHPTMVPYGCFPCADGEWLSIAVKNDAEWRALCDTVGHPALAYDERFAAAATRHAHAYDLDSTLAALTIDKTAAELATQLRAQGVAAFKSLNSLDLISDDELWRRGFFQRVVDDQQRESAIVGAPWHMSLTIPATRRPAPRLGEHNDYVLGTVLGLSAEQRRRLVAQKVIY